MGIWVGVSMYVCACLYRVNVYMHVCARMCMYVRVYARVCVHSPFEEPAAFYHLSMVAPTAPPLTCVYDPHQYM